MSKLFYAVCDSNGVVGVANTKYPSLKAVFSAKEDAEIMLKKNGGYPLVIVPVYLEDIRQ
ncbi:TPA: hypothetical protein ACWLTD_003521 [Morganella morganii]|uniref:hypothetical protein n=1 Tax=Morganella morganii TaxID=582 RepID=UPI000F833CB9|nr:hypothetical protein [Morganella morganii]RTY32681.1 hypothetical protein EKS33_07720 [Morganella morganii subsp. morganii]HEI8863158.1 hypothetical protein [Morganella morganii]